MVVAPFALGQTLIARAALDVLHPQDVKACLDRHANGDWGELGDADRRENEVALAQGLRLFSVYNDQARRRFWIISEADRSATTVLLPEDY